MSVVLGSSIPARLMFPAAGAAFPKHVDASHVYTSPDGAIVVPSGALDRWYAYRATRGAARGDVVVFGDSTTFGSGGNYSWMQRMRDRAVTYGFADGGKGIFAGAENALTYDPPEINGFVSTTFAGAPDTYDNLTGNYLYDTGSPSGHTLTLQFRTSDARLWYRSGGSYGDFTYAIDGGSPVTVHAVGPATTSRFVYLSGLTAGTTHSIVITNGSGLCGIALAPVNTTGFAGQKHAVSGSTFQNFFYGALTPTSPFTQAGDGFRYQTALGLVHTSVDGAGSYRGAPVDTSYASNEKVSPILAMSHLGFNDLTNAASGDTQAWNEYVKRFAGACYDASCDGIIISGQLPYNDNWVTYGAARFNALKSEAAAQGLAFIDFLYPISGPSLSYSGGPTNPHLTKGQYQTQADYLWDNLLGLA